MTPEELKTADQALYDVQGIDITGGIPSQIYVRIGRGGYDDEYELARDVAEAVRAECAAALADLQAENDRLRAACATMRKALDDVYNHNEASRAAVIQHYGIHHCDATAGSELLAELAELRRKLGEAEQRDAQRAEWAKQHLEQTGTLKTPRAPVDNSAPLSGSMSDQVTESMKPNAELRPGEPKV